MLLDEVDVLSAKVKRLTACIDELVGGIPAAAAPPAPQAAPRCTAWPCSAAWTRSPGGWWPRVTNLVAVSARLDPSWSVLASPSTPAVDRCVDIFVRAEGTFGFEEFRRDPEDMGAWTPVAYYSTREFATEAEALSAARDAVFWLPAVLDGVS
jgi:hypothetical protein